MTQADTEAADGAAEKSPTETPAPGRLLRRAVAATVALCAAAALVLALGFPWFVWRIPGEEVELDHNADGIVVLTGGASRISDGIELLAAGRARRLLISGANRATTFAEILRLNPEYAGVVRCCVDFDRSLNTLGNAVETRHWAESHNFRSLIVVTSSYHMPRAMAEIANQLPEARLMPFPVVKDRVRAEPWWANSATTRLLLSEYLKYVVARIRIQLQLAPAAREIG